MELNVWTQPSGYSFGTWPEREQINGDNGLLLPVINDAGVTYSVISGSLPTGLFISGNSIKGSPYVNNNVLDYSFCIRATNGTSFADRTFKISINEILPPEFITPGGLLDAGPRHQFYVIDGSYVEYQIDAVDLNAEVGQVLSFNIESGNGALPPGLALSQSGLISGFVGPTLVTVAGVPSETTKSFPFVVTINDGVNFNTRAFTIFVVDPDVFRADSLIPNNYNGASFTSDVTYLQEPVWVSPSYLGIFRANNYITIPLGVYDKKNVVFRVEQTNTELYATTYQLSINDNVYGGNSLTITNASDVPTIGQVLSFKYYANNATDTTYTITNVTALPNGVYRLNVNPELTMTLNNGIPFFIGSRSQLPPGMTFNTLTSEVYGRVPFQPAVTRTYTFTVTATRSYTDSLEFTTSSKTFTVDMLGDVTSTITWVTPENLGTLYANYVSALSVEATSTVASAIVSYKKVSGSLPPGISLSVDGELIGTVNQYYNADTGVLGLISFSETNPEIKDQTFDNGTTTFDREFSFTLEANDQYQYSTQKRTFTISIETPNTVEYSNVTAKPFLPQNERTLWRNFITNTSIFTPESIYRPNDPSFGVQTNLEMLVFAGIQTELASVYANSMLNGFKRKRFQFSGFEKATAKDPVTGKEVYEIVYVKMFDPLEPNKTHLPSTILGGDYYPNSITNWRERLSEGLLTERNYLPLWMRTIQLGLKEPSGYVMAIPLCYCKVGTADTILLNIKYSGFEFNHLDYTVDRFIINPVAGVTGAKYLAFRDDRTTI